MSMKTDNPRGRIALCSAFALLALIGAAAAHADHSQPSPDIAQMDYTPIGFYKPGDPVPSPSTPPANANPSGKWVAYDTNVFESLNLPSRHPGDESATDPPGTGDPRHGFCPPNDPTFLPWGKCNNHQLEYLDYFEKTMKETLGPYGVVIHRYPFVSPGTGSRGAYLDAASGQAYNITATVPGADHPDESVLISGHYDFTDSGPAAAWDSAEGHTEVIRAAWIMADYWRKTGTRPSATVKFIPWDSEESGTFGSIDYVENNIPPGEEGKVRGYFNMDPCAGAYPAFRNGNPLSRVPEVLQLANPDDYEDPAVKARIESFNKRAADETSDDDIVDQVLDHLDDTLDIGAGQKREIFVSDREASAGENGGTSQRDEIATAVGGLAIFSSDYANFAGVGIPIFNLFPDYFGPHADGSPASAEGVTILHTPRDNLTTINALTRADPSGQTVSEGWAKGMEMCAHLESWYMLQPEMGGAQTSSPDVVAYYEALPNEAIVNQNIKFDATGSYRYSQLATREIGQDAELEYSWDFGDGTSGTGKTVEHGYKRVGKYQSKLTVTNGATGAKDTMELPITVTPSNLTGPVLDKPPAEDPDGTFPLAWKFDGSKGGFREFSIEESTDVQTLLSDDAEGDINALWTPSTTTDPQVHPWQKSDGSPSANGNQKHGGNSSYWTGTFPTAPSPTDQESVLTLKQPLRVPESGEPTLSYFSLFQSESDDEGRVDVAIDDGDPNTEPEFENVDGVSGIFSPTEPGGLVATEFEARKVDLTRFKGKQILVRFRYILGPNDPVASQPVGWYIDDIGIRSGTWSPIGTSTETTFTVFGKTVGTYGYRVKGVYNDGIQTEPSNEESVKVAQGASAPGGPGATACGVGFGKVAARPTGRGLRFGVTRRVQKPFSVTVFQQSNGRRVLDNRAVARFKGRTGSFTWPGNSRLRGGFYFARFRMKLGSKRVDLRDRALLLRGGKFRSRPDFQRRDRCTATLRSFRLSRAVFGGSNRRPLGIAFQLTSSARVSLTVTRLKKRVLSFAPTDRQARVNYKFRIPARDLRGGDYRVTIKVEKGAKTSQSRLVSRKL